MNPIVHFEIPADDDLRAKAFYEKVFGWKTEKYDMPKGDIYWMVYTTEFDANHMSKIPGAINGGLMKRHDPKQSFMNYIHVESIDKMLKQIEANGGKIIIPKQEIDPNMGWMALFQDTEGNIMGLHEITPKK